MTSNIKIRIVKTASYLIAIIAAIYLMAPEIGKGQSHFSDKVSLIGEVQANKSKTTPGYSLWGPVKLQNIGVQTQIAVSVTGLYNSEVYGEVSLIESKKFHDANGNLLPKNDILRVLKGSKGDKQKVLEVYSFEYEFWHASGIADGERWSENDIDKTVYIKLEKPGTYYVLLEHNSVKRITSPQAFSIEINEGRSQDGWYFGATALFIILFIGNLTGLIRDSIKK
ncbi:MAG: hypothetical protein IEMM0008_1844 [bacterium]|nr:MAG: hypothetical protein IEMM0008_1844 [bacterium]